MLMLGDKTVVPLTELLRNSGFKKWSITDYHDNFPSFVKGLFQ